MRLSTHRSGAALALVFAAFAAASDVVELNSKTFDEFIKAEPLALVEWYAVVLRNMHKCVTEMIPKVRAVVRPLQGSCTPLRGERDFSQGEGHQDRQGQLR